MNSILEFLRDFFTVRKCAVCEKVLAEGDDELCPACRDAYRALRSQVCTLCGKGPMFCACFGQKKSYFERTVRLFFYQDEFSRAVVSSLKYKGRRATVEFLGKELACAVVVEKENRDLSDFTVTWVPRGRKNYRRYGFDQSSLLAGIVARELGLATERVFIKKGKAKQKAASTVLQRIKNAKKGFALTDAPVEGKRFLLVDDVTTSGSTLAACSSLLRSAGAKEVWAVTVARTQSRLPDA